MTPPTPQDDLAHQVGRLTAVAASSAELEQRWWLDTQLVLDGRSRPVELVVAHERDRMRLGHRILPDPERTEPDYVLVPATLTAVDRRDGTVLHTLHRRFELDRNDLLRGIEWLPSEPWPIAPDIPDHALAFELRLHGRAP